MIQITQGDTTPIELTVKSSAGTPHNLTGATLVTLFPRANGADIEVPHAAHAITNALGGAVTVSLTQQQSQALMVGEKQNIVVRVSQGGIVQHFHGTEILSVRKASTKK